jgi:hypothetical protein
MRDRLLSNYTVMPVVRRIRSSLLASSAACVASVLLLQGSPDGRAAAARSDMQLPNREFEGATASAGCAQLLPVHVRMHGLCMHV